VLEIGAGQGSVGAELARRYDYLGVEPDRSSFEVAARRIGDAGRVLNSTLEELSETETFDLVCAFEVLEHIEDDLRALASWIERIRPGGRLLLSVPAGPNRFGASDIKVGHYRRYDRDGLRDLLTQAGLDEIEIRTYGFPLGYALEVLRNQVVKRTGSRGTREERTAASGRLFQPSDRTAVLTAAAAAPFRLVQRPFAGTRLGTGLVALARRPA
jgi:SAM-dependent methyltransferase